MAIQEVVEWSTTPKDNIAHHPVGPDGRPAARSSLSFQQMQAALARWRDTIPAPIDWKAGTETGFHSIGIDDNSSFRTILLQDTKVQVGDNSSTTHTLQRASTLGGLAMSGGALFVSGGSVVVYGGSHATTPGDVEMRSAANQFFHWDESAGSLALSTGIGAKALALTLDSSQLATFAGAVTVVGNQIYGSVGTLVANNNTGAFWVSGGNTISDGAGILLYGGAAFRAGDIQIRGGVLTSDVIVFDQSVGDLQFLTGSGTPKTLALTIDSSQLATFSGALTTIGAFTSLGIDDNATAERLQLTDSNAVFGANDAQLFSFIRASNTGRMGFAGGNSTTFGGNFQLHGGAHSQAGDIIFNSGVNTWMHWDESIGQLKFSTGIGTKASALTINASKLATFAGAVTVQGAVTYNSSTSNFTSSTNAGLFWLSGGNTLTVGSQILLYGGAHPTRAGDFDITGGATDTGAVIAFDESVGDLRFLTGSTAPKTLALTIDVNQNLLATAHITKTGTALVAGDFALSAGWGTTASVGTILGNDQRCSFVVTSTGTGQGASPTITLTFTDGAWPVAPVVVISRTSGSALTTPFLVSSVTTTALVLTYAGTPVAAETFGISVIILG